MKVQCVGSSAALTQTPRSRASRATATLTSPASVATNARSAPARSPSRYPRDSSSMRPSAASAASVGVVRGLTTVTRAPAARSPVIRRSATGPPPTMRQRRPVRSRSTGKYPISAVDPMRRPLGRDVARDRLGELARQERAELVVRVARGELAEVLGRQAVGQKGAQQALDRRGHLGRGQAETDGSGHGPMPAHGAADAEVVGIDERPAQLDLLAFDAEVSDPVLAAAVRAARDVDPQVLVEPGQPPLERLHEPARKPFRLRDRQLAKLRARARDGPTPERRGVEGEARVLEVARDVVDALAANFRDQEGLR